MKNRTTKLINIVLWGVLALGLTIFLFSCSATNKTTKTVENSFSTNEVDTLSHLIPWSLQIDPNLDEEAPVNFYNQYEIVVRGSINGMSKEYVDGRVVFSDRGINFDFSVPKNTKSEIVKVIKNNGMIRAIKVQFKLVEQENDAPENYQHIFYLGPNNNFILNKKMNIIVGGKTYNYDNVSVLGPKEGEPPFCKLLFYPEYNDSTSNIKNIADGVPDVLGRRKIR